MPEETVKTVGYLMERLGGELLHGSRETNVAGVDGSSAATALDLVFAENAKAVEEALGSWAAAAVVPLGSAVPGGTRLTVVGAKQPRLWFARAAELLRPELHSMGVHAAAVVAKDAVLGGCVTVGPCAVVGHGAVLGDHVRVDAGAVIGDGVKIGAWSHVYPRAVLYSGVELGERVVIHAGAVLGADGFGYVRDAETGRYVQFPQQGRLVLEDDVEIGANTTIDRGALAETRVRRGAKFDNLVHVGHNCEIGEDVIIVSQTGISGSSTVGKGAVLAGQVGVGDHAHIGPGVILGGQAGVLSGKTENRRGTVLWGTPAKPIKEYLRELATLGKLSRRGRD